MHRRVLFLAIALLGLALPALAQVPDSAGLEQLRQGLQSGQLTPDVLRARIQAAGMSIDQVRQGLRALGYPENLLDQYLNQRAAPGATSLTAAQVEGVLRRLSIPPLDLLQADTMFLLPDTSAIDSLLADTAGLVQPIELPVFGRNLFKRATTRFAPVTMGPVPENYRLGPGDELVLILTGDVQEVYPLPVTREGFVVIPNVGRVSVNGLTLDQLRNALYTYLGQVYSGVMRGPEATTFFEVSIAALRRNQVFVVGEVERPGQYEVTSVSTALDALYQAGGPAENGSFRNVEIRRGDRTVATLDIYEYLTRGAATGDVPLDQGDVVFVPVRSRRVEIDGNVIRPGIYELKEQEGLRELLEVAGGIEPEADLRRIQVDRVLPADQREPGVYRRVFDVDVARALGGEGEFVPLAAGDKVYVFAVADDRRSTLTVRGNVWAPGVYGHTPGVRLSELIERAGGLRDDTYLGRAQIVRLDPADLSRSVIPVTLNGADDPELEEFDEVVVYSVSEFREQRFVTIRGSVNNPGVYEYQDGMTLRDLVLMAGGLRDDAHLLEAEVARLDTRPDRPGELTELIAVPIDSSYAVAESGAAGSDGRGSSDGVSARPRAPEFVLSRYDDVFIRQQPGWDLQRTVSITGEVRFPGPYSLERKDERLSELLERAGGLTPDAHPGGIRFLRRREIEVADTASAYTRVNVDLQEIFEDPTSDQNLYLMDGDSIHIPEYTATVQVDGAVLSPTSVLYRPGAGLDYYIANAGGYARDADEGRTWVQYVDGSIRTVSSFLFFKSRPDPGPGSSVFVPGKPRRSASAIDFRALAAILGSLTAMVIVIARN